MEVIDTMPTNARHHRITNKRDTPVPNKLKAAFLQRNGDNFPRTHRHAQNQLNSLSAIPHKGAHANSKLKRLLPGLSAHQAEGR